MKKMIHAHHAGLAVGGALGLWHLMWSFMVATGMAQVCIDFIFKLHMIEPPYKVLPFSLGYAVGLVIVTSVIGYVIGLIIGALWDAVQK